MLRDIKHGERIANMTRPKINLDDENEDWLGKNPDELTAKLDDVKVEEVLDALDRGMDSTPDPL
jgi:hypothetical protein